MPPRGMNAEERFFSTVEKKPDFREKEHSFLLEETCRKNRYSPLVEKHPSLSWL